MPPAAGVGVQGDRISVKPMAAQQPQQLPMMTPASEAFAKDAIIAWFRGEFAAANAIIDALCGHLRQMDDGASASAYESAFAAIHRRRLNWIPVLQMQKYYSIADVTVELKKVAEKKRAEENDVGAKKTDAVANGGCTVAINDKEKQTELNLESSVENSENSGGEVVDEDFTSEITDTGNYSNSRSSLSNIQNLLFR